MRKDEVWQVGPGGTYIETVNPLGYDLLINGQNHYINFNMDVGVMGYGFRDNNGVIEFKNDGGAWTPVPSSSGTGTVTSVSSADGSITVTNPTTTVDLSVVKAPKWSTARLLAGNSVDGSANVPFANKFIIQGTIDAGLTGAQFLGTLATGIVKNTTTTGVLSIAVAGTDYQAPITLTTTGTSGAATFIANVLNIPQYAGSTYTGTTNRITVTGTVIDIAATYVGQSSFTTLGTITTGTLSTGAVIAGVTMTLGSDASYDVYYRGPTGVLTRLANGTNGQFLGANTGAAPTWQTPAGSSGITIGTTTIASGTTTRILYDNAGVVGEYTLTGTGTVVAMQTSPTFITKITSPLILGGTGTTQTLTYQTTSGVGTTGADHIFLVGNNGATEAMRILNNGNVGIGSNNPASRLVVVQADNIQHVTIVNALANNLSAGMALTYSGLEASGSNSNVDISIIPKGAGGVGFGTAGINSGGLTTSLSTFPNTSGVSAGPASSTTQTITHSLGRVPAVIRLHGISAFVANISALPAGVSFGTYTSSGNKCITIVNQPTTAVNPTNSSTFAISISGATGVATGVVQNVTSTSFDIVWTVSASAAVAQFIWEVQ